jgi:esterase/lipase superfamily enzyme
VGSGTVTLTPDMKALQPVYFATDRTRVQGAPLEESFAGGRDPNLTYGRAIVSIPKSHEIGNVERPKFRFIRLGVEPETDADHFRIKDIAWLDRGTLVDQLKGGADSVLLFIHGYNVSFADAIFKAAQIAFDANFAGTVLVFSWPSAGSLVKYDEDRESAEFAVPHLAQTFRLLTDEIGKKNVYIVAHSMGNQVLVDALLESALSKANLTITELVMAAPDVDKDVFGTKVDQVRAVAKNITLYASAADKALLASGEKSFGTRLGYVGKNGPNVFDGIDVIDVTAVGDDMLGLDHGTFSSSRAVLDDLGRLIRSLTHLPPDVRTPTLKFMPDKAHVEYWLYPP